MPKIKSALKISIAILFNISIATVAFSQTNDGSNLTPQEIVKKTLDAYAALSSYSDTGTTVKSEAGGQATTTTFSLRLQRPNLFRVLWTQTSGNLTNTGRWWSDGNTNFGENSSYLLGGAVGQETNDEPTIMWLPFALSDERTESWLASLIPEIFFAEIFRSIEQDNILTQITSYPTNTTLSDGKIGNIDCHVVSITFNAVNFPNFHTGRTIARLWIGKQDYLLRQIQSTHEAPQMQISNVPIARVKSREMVLTQTHENISLNQKFSVADFEQKRDVSKPSSITLHSTPRPIPNSQSLPQANTSTANSTVTVLSAEFGMGKNVADVNARITELLHVWPKGFTVNAKNLGQDPLPGKKKNLVIHYECNGFTNVFTIPAGYFMSREDLVDNAGNNHPRSAQ